MGRYRVAIDTGGTFSDFFYLNEETGASQRVNAAVPDILGSSRRAAGWVNPLVTSRRAGRCF
jgi:N-methylhydantoinase A/oxoprolinase/acetone carboxylase beta subunit